MQIYETLHGVSSVCIDSDGVLESCMLEEENIVEISCGSLVLKWQEDVRTKHIPSLSFYPDGILKAIALEAQTEISTPLGKLPAEFLTFYPNGALQRIFPTNGKITAYWSEEDEAGLNPILFFSLPIGAFRAKLTAIHFYPDGALRSMSFWPGETAVLRVLQGLMPTRIGFSLYEDGAIESVEPPYPMDIATPIGMISAYDPDALGIHGDSNSLSFFQDGAIRSVMTADNKIEIITPDKQSVFFGPTQQSDPLLDDCTIIVPVRISFTSDRVTLENGIGKKSFSLTQCCFRVYKLDGTTSKQVNCGDCSSCNLCS